MKIPEFSPIPRRGFLADFGMGFTGLALGAMLNSDGIARAATTGWQPPDGKPHFPPKAKRVIWLFMIGGVSHVETFDPKPALTKYGGLKLGDTPFKDFQDRIRWSRRTLREVIAGLPQDPSQPVSVAGGFPEARPERNRSQRLVAACVRMHRRYRGGAFDVDDGQQSRRPDAVPLGPTCTWKVEFPTIGSWVHYGLGSLNENLPQFVVLGEPSIPAAAALPHTGPLTWGRSTPAYRWRFGRKIRSPTRSRA